MQLKEYMNQTFPGVTLVPHIYFQWKHHLHFHFWKGKCPNVERTDDLNMEYFSQLNIYNNHLFEDIFSKEDEVFLVTNVYRFIKENVKNPQKINIYRRFIHNRELKYHIRQETIPFYLKKKLTCIVLINFH